MKKLLIAPLLILSSITFATPKVSFKSDCVFSATTEGYTQYVNLINIAKVMVSSDGKSISLDGMSIRDLTPENTNEIIKQFVSCSKR